MHMKVATVSLIGPDMTVNGFMADLELSCTSQMPADLLRAPLQYQQSVDDPVLCFGVVFAAAGAPSSAVGAFLCFAVAIVTVVDTTVSGDLPTDSASVSPKDSGDGGGTIAFLSKQRDRIPLVRGELVILHGAFPILGGAEKKPVSQITSLFFRSVAVSI